MNVPLWVVLPVIVLVTVATRADVQTRKIPNSLTIPASLLALIAHGVMGGRAGLLGSLAGLGLCLAAMLPGWLLRWMGAGDVKLMMAVGAWLAFPQAVIALLASFVAGGLISAVLALRRGLLGEALRGAALLGAWTLAAPLEPAPPPVTTGIRFPFAVAVMAGTIFASWIRM